MLPPRFATLEGALDAAQARANTTGKPHHVFRVNGADGWFAVSTNPETCAGAELVATCDPAPAECAEGR